MAGTAFNNLESAKRAPTESQGFWIKSAFSNDGGQETKLMKVDAGAFVDTHTHERLEQIYVLSGSFYDEENTYVAGDFIVRQAGSPHTAGSHDGATMILIYSAP